MSERLDCYMENPTRPRQLISSFRSGLHCEISKELGNILKINGCIRRR